MPSSIEKVSHLLSNSKKAIAFTGAGISTQSGIPDFRSPGGLWSRYQPIMFQDFLASEETRRRYWQMKKEGYYEMRTAKPNCGHIALAQFEAAGKIVAVITQNIDGLHQDAGSRKVLELHGTSRSCVCLKCGDRVNADVVQHRLEAGDEVPHCNRCGGLLKSATISFGQQLPAEVLTDAINLCMLTDLILAIGSSLVVEPAASLPLMAKNNGAGLVIINREKTPLDIHADVVIHDSIGPTLSEIARMLALTA